MSLKNTLLKQIESSVETFISTVAIKYNLNRNELYSVWSDEKAPLSPKKASPKEPSLSTINMNDCSPERLSKATLPELRALCKTKGVKCSGKKDELLSRLLEKEGAKETIVIPTKKPSSKKQFTPIIPSIPIRKNKFGNLEHPETHIVFDRTTEIAIGRQDDNGTVVPLTDEDIENCRKFKFRYELPSNLDRDRPVEQESGSDVELKEGGDEEVDLAESEEDVVIESDNEN